MTIQQAGEYPSNEELDQMEAAVQATLKPGETAPADAGAQATQATQAAQAAQGAAAAPPKPLTWEERVKAAGLTEDQAHHILTEVLTKGHFERTFTVYGRVPVVLRTRDAFARRRLLEIYDQYRIADPGVQRELYLRVALAGSLVKFANVTYAHVDPNERDPAKVDEAFTARLHAVDRLPDPVLEETLFPLVSRFDQWVYAALSNGAPSGF